MPIIINEFEIIPERPATQSEQLQPPATQAPATPPPRPEEIIRVQRVDYERRRRVRAT